MKPKSSRLWPVATGLLLTVSLTPAAEIPKAQNTGALNTPASWVPGVVPGPDDVMLWDSNFTAPGAIGNMSDMGGSLTVAGIKVTNVGGTRNAAATVVGFQNIGTAHTLTLGAGGIDLSTALHALSMRPRVMLSASQTWNISNANTAGSPSGFNNNEDLAFSANGVVSPFNFGGHTVTTTGAGQATITSGYTLSNGSLKVGNNLLVIQGGNNQVTTLQDTLDIEVLTGSTLRFQNNSGAAGVSLNSSAPVTVSGGTLIFQLNSSLALNSAGLVTVNSGTVNFNHSANGVNNISGGIHFAGDGNLTDTGGSAATNPTNFTGNLTGSGNINYLNTATSAFGFLRMSGDNSGYTGTITLAGGSNNRRLVLASPTAGSNAATWVVNAGNTLSLTGVTATLGVLHGAGTIDNNSPAEPAVVRVGEGIFSGNLVNGTGPSLGLTKFGPGTLTLTGANTHTGPTVVEQGSLFLSTNQLTGTTFSVADGATLGIQVELEGDQLLADSLTLGETTGATLLIDFGSLPNPTAAPLDFLDLVVNGPSTIRVAGSNLSVGTFPLIDATTFGGLGLAGLTLQLPPRIVGNLVPGQLQVEITGTDSIKWRGDVSTLWDIDPDGTGTTGTANWRTVSADVATRYVQAPNGSDSVRFDDTAATGSVMLDSVVTPGAVVVDNSTLAYTLGGSGRISGTMALTKRGTGTLTLANTTPHDFTGGTVIEENSTLVLGDGTTPTAGQLGGNILVDGTLVLNRPDDHTFANLIDPISLGSITKQQANVLTVPVNQTIPLPLAINAGTVRFTAGGILSGVLSGSGTLESTAGDLQIAGFDPNTHDGPVNATGGILTLNKPADTQAVGGDITITGGAVLRIFANNQIADTATINHFGTSGDLLSTSTGQETVANVNVNCEGTLGQFICRNEFTVAGTAMVTNGIFGVASGHNATAESIVVESATGIIRIAASAGPSMLTVGSGGITASAGRMEVKFNGNNQDAVVNLGGDFTATGDFAISNAGYNGPNLNLIKLISARTFNIADGAVVTVQADIGDDHPNDLSDDTNVGSLLKTGGGTLTLTNLCSANHKGGTTVAAGTVLVNGILTKPAEVTAVPVQVEAGATLGGTGTISLPVNLEGSLAPAGAGVGTLTIADTATFAGGSSYLWQINDWTGITPGTTWDNLNATDIAITAAAASRMTIVISGSPANFTESNAVFAIATASGAITGFSADAFAVDATGFTGSGTWEVRQTGATLELAYTAGAAGDYDLWAQAAGLTAGVNDAPDFDAELDGRPNFLEFAFDDNPLSGASSGKEVSKVANIGGSDVLTLTLPVRQGAVFAGGPSLVSGVVSDLTYTIEATADLAAWTTTVSEVTGDDAAAIRLGLPPLSTGWTYRTFRVDGALPTTTTEAFIRAKIEFATP